MPVCACHYLTDVCVCVQGFDKVGYLKKKESVGGFKRRWFTLKGKSLSSFKRVSVDTPHMQMMLSTGVVY